MVHQFNNRPVQKCSSIHGAFTSEQPGVSTNYTNYTNYTNHKLQSEGLSPGTVTAFKRPLEKLQQSSGWTLPHAQRKWQEWCHTLIAGESCPVNLYWLPIADYASQRLGKSAAVGARVAVQSRNTCGDGGALRRRTPRLTYYCQEASNESPALIGRHRSIVHNRVPQVPSSWPQVTAREISV